MFCRNCGTELAYKEDPCKKCNYKRGFGVDYCPDCGAETEARARKCTECGGKYVEIDHGNGITARYCGLSDKVSVIEGNIVSAGTKLGLIGEIPSECEDGCHLHLEFYKDGEPVNPEVIIEG